MADIKLFRKGNVFDFEIGENGDFVLEEGMDTAILMSYYGEVRADESEVAHPQFRRGWWGNLIGPVENYEYGSKLWILESARNTQETANRAVTYVQEGFAWMAEDGLIKGVEVTADRNPENITINIKLIRSNNDIQGVAFNLWENTNLDVN